MVTNPQISLDKLVNIERRPAEVIADQQYAEIGIYCFGKGIFHKSPRSGLEVGNKKLFLIKEGDFIPQITFAWEGAVALASKAEDGMYGSSRFPTFRVEDKQCFPQYLRYYFRTHEGLEQLVKISPGSAGRNRVLSLKRFSEVLIPLPPIEEQKRIVARIEELAGKVEEARELRSQAVQECNHLSRSIIFHEAVQKTPTPMNELVTLRSPDIEVQPAENYQFAGVYSFGRGVFPKHTLSGMDFSYKRLTRLSAGNFVYPKLMAWEGALGSVPENCNGLTVSPEFPVFEVNTEKVLPETLDTYFRTPSVWPKLAEISTGTNMRRRRLHPSNFMKFEFPLPNMKTQQKLREVKNKLTAIEFIQTQTATELDALLPAILDKAFKGEL